MIPTLETERLRLRGHTRRDFEASAAMWADPTVVRYVSGKTSSREESWRRFLMYAGHWTVLGYGYWVIEDKTDGRFLGEVGFANFKREMTPTFEAPEQGWALSPAAQGRGIATEAMRAVLTWGEAHFNRTDFVCMISPDNAASLRVAEKLGYRPFTRADYHGAPSVLHRRA